MANRFKCQDCNQSFSRRFTLQRHLQRYHINNDIIEKCVLCGQLFNNITILNKHYRKYHKPSKKFYEKESAFRKNVVTYRYNYLDDEYNFTKSQTDLINAIKKTIVSEALKKTIIKANLIYICEMSMTDHAGDKITKTLIPFRAPGFIANASDKNSIHMNIRHAFTFQNNSMEEFCNSGSNWVFDRAVSFDIEITALRPLLMGNNNESDTESESDRDSKNQKDGYPDIKNVKKLNLKDIKNKKFLYNPKNKDYKCFLYCLHNFFIQEKDENLTFKEFEKTLDLKGITFPISIVQIKKFMKQNTQLDVKINILLRHINGHVYPYEYSIGNGSSFINLLLLNRKSQSNHFLRIIDINKFLRKIYANRAYERKFFCENCLNYFYSDETLTKHKTICCLNKARLELTPEDTTLKFKNVKNQHPLEYIAFLDFECILPNKTIICKECTHLRCKCDKSFTNIVTDQIPITYSFVILDSESKIIHTKTYSGKNAADHFIDHLLKEENEWIKPLFSTFNEMKLTPSEEMEFKRTDKCYMCENYFTEELIKCRDHCHFSGKFLGAACHRCNLERRKSRKLRIFMHNGSKFDFHFIIKALHNKEGIINLHVLPYNTENFRTINFNSFIFLDSLSFLQSSLAQLSADLSKTKNKYKILRQTDLVKTNKMFDLKKFKIVLEKSFFPYEFW